MYNNTIKFNWNIKENKKNVLEIYDQQNVIKCICKMGDQYNCVDVMVCKDSDYNNEITINFNGHYSHILKEVALIIDTLRAYIENQKGTFEEVTEKETED